MGWDVYVKLAILAVLIVVVIYVIEKNPDLVQKNYWMSHYVESPWQVYQRSTGVFDEAAALALRRSVERANLTPENHILSATVISRNILAQEHVPERNPQGFPTRGATERAQIRRELYSEAREHYMAALNGLDDLVQLPTVRRRRVAVVNDNPPEQPLNQMMTFIIDEAAGFAFRGVGIMLENDPILADIFVEGWPPEDLAIFAAGPGGVFEVDRPLAEAAERRRETLVKDRQNAAATTAALKGGGKKAIVDAYVKLATQNTDDPQNTHDRGVLTCLKAIVDRLRADQADQVLPTPSEVLAEIQAQGVELSEGRAHRLADVATAVARIGSGERVVAVGATDGECLSRVWLRAADSRNVAVAGQMRQATFDAIYDCWEDGMAGRNLVCVNGRTSRLLSSLVLLDWDKRNWEVKKLEEFKNAIFAKAAKVIRSEAKKAKSSPDLDVRNAGRLYLARTLADIQAIGDVPAAANEQLATDMRAKIGVMVDEYVKELDAELGAKGGIPEYMVDSIKEEARAAVA